MTKQTPIEEYIEATAKFFKTQYPKFSLTDKQAKIIAKEFIENNKGCYDGFDKFEEFIEDSVEELM